METWEWSHIPVVWKHGNGTGPTNLYENETDWVYVGIGTVQSGVASVWDGNGTDLAGTGLERGRWNNLSDLYGLPVIMEDVDADDGLVELRVGGLDHLIVFVLAVGEGIESTEHKIKQRSEVLGARRCDKDVGVAARRTESLVQNVTGQTQLHYHTCPAASDA